MADKKISEFDSFPGVQDSKVHYIISSGDAGGQDTNNYKVSFPDLVLSVSGELKDSLGGGGGVPDPDGSFNFGPTDPSNNTDVVNFNQGDNVRMYIDDNGGVNVSEKLIVSDGKETILGGVTTIKGETTIQEKLTVADGKETELGGPVTIKGDSTFEKSAIFTDLTNDPDPSTGKLYRKGDDIYFGGQKLLTDGSSGAGKWSDGTTAGQIHYSGGDVGIGTDSPEEPLDVRGAIKTKNTNDDSEVKLVSSGGMPHINLQRGTSANWKITSKGNGLQQVLTTSLDTSELMTVQADGNVGIGTTSPAQKLSVDGNLLLSKTDVDGGNDALLFSSGGAADHPLLRIYDKDGDTGAAITANGNSYLSAKGGNVGIGTESPDFLLDLVEKDGGVQLQMARSNSYEGSAWMGADSNGFHLGVGEYAGAGGDTASANGFNVNTLGNVGIGELNPSQKLVVRNQSTTNDRVAIGLSSQDGTQNGSISHIDEEGKERITLSAGGFSVDHLAILNNGNVGIGLERSSSTSIAVSHSNITPLQVNKPGNEIVPLLTLSNYDHTDNSTSHGSALDFGLARDSGTQKSNAGRIYVGKTEVWTSGDATLNSFMSFNIFTEDNLSEKLRIDSEGVVVNGNIDAKPSNQSDQFVGRFTTEHNTNMMHSALIFAKTKQDGTATADGSIMGSVGWQGKDTNGTDRHCGMIKVVQRGAANTSGRITDMYLHTADGNLYDNASISNDPKHEKLRLKGGGGVVLARLNSAPGNPEAGEMYFNTNNNTFYGYNGTSWKALS